MTCFAAPSCTFKRDVQRIRGARPSGDEPGAGARLHDQRTGARGRYEGVLGVLSAEGVQCYRIGLYEVKLIMVVFIIN